MGARRAASVSSYRLFGLCNLVADRTKCTQFVDLQLKKEYSFKEMRFSEKTVLQGTTYVQKPVQLSKGTILKDYPALPFKIQ